MTLPYANSATMGFPEEQLDDPDDEKIGPALCVACLQDRHHDPYEAAACECDCHNEPQTELTSLVHALFEATAWIMWARLEHIVFNTDYIKRIANGTWGDKEDNPGWAGFPWRE